MKKHLIFARKVASAYFLIISFVYVIAYFGNSCELNAFSATALVIFLTAFALYGSSAIVCDVAELLNKKQSN